MAEHDDRQQRSNNNDTIEKTPSPIDEINVRNFAASINASALVSSS